MALIPGFEYDIFISYAHVDNMAIAGQSHGWIQQFHDNLKQKLDRRYGRMGVVKIWWDDKKIDGAQLFDETIKEGIKKSALIICLNSPGYRQSKYCRQELEFFHEKAQSEPTGLKVADRSRIVHVLLNNIPFEEWPSQLNGTTGFPFHDALEREDFGDPLKTNSEKYIEQMRDLRDALWHLITDFQEQLSAKSIPLTPKSDAFTIYLGEVADTLRTQRKRIVSELEKKGFQVITGIPPPDEEAAHQKATEDALQKADLAVHLLDRYPGKEITGAPEIWYPQKQTEISLKTDKPQMIWLPKETDFSKVEEEQYQKFLNNLEAGKITSKAYEFIRGSKSTLAKQIMDFAEQLKISQVEPPSQGEKLSVLLDTHLNDQAYAFDLGKALLENQVQPFINPQEDDPRKNINLLGDRIGRVRKMIFLYGKVSKEWLLERMSAALQLIITNNYPIEDFYIYLAPPEKQADDITINQKFLKINIVDNSKKQIVDKAVLDQFLIDLKAVEV